MAAYAATITLSGSGAVWQLNAARPWWWLGNSRGNTSSVGGWLRIYGQNIAFGGAHGCAASETEYNVNNVDHQGDDNDIQNIQIANTVSSLNGSVRLALTPISSPIKSSTHHWSTTTNGSKKSILLRSTMSTTATKRAAADVTLLQSVNASCYTAFFQLPPSLSAGVYNATITNDLPGSPAQLLSDPIIVMERDFWPMNPVFNVKAGDSSGLKSALSSAGRAGGGLVRVEAGTTTIGPETLTIPCGVTLQGQDTGTTVLLTDPATPIDRVIISVGDVMGASRGGQEPTATKTTGKIGSADGDGGGPTGRVGDNINGMYRARLQGLTVRVNSQAGTVINIPKGTWGSRIERVNVDGTSRASNLPRGNAVGVYGDGATVRDCSLDHGGNCTATHWPHNTAHYAGAVSHLLWQNNHALCRCQGYSFDSPRGLAVLDSSWDSRLSEDAEGSGISSFTNNVAKNVYFGNNLDLGHRKANKTWETFTSDGPNGAWFGPVARAEAGATNLSLPLQVDALRNWSPTTKGNVTSSSSSSSSSSENQKKKYLDVDDDSYGPESGTFTPGEALVVMSGPTAGAIVPLSALKTNTSTSGSAEAAAATAGLAVAIAPLATAVGGPGALGAVMPLRSRMVFEGNLFVNGTTFQFFGAGDNVHVANNTFKTFGGLVAWGLWYQGGYQPTLRTQWRGNTLEDGGVMRTLVSPHNSSYAGPMVIATVFRSNVLRGSSNMGVSSRSDLTLIEGNVYESPVPTSRHGSRQSNRRQQEDNGVLSPPAWPYVQANATRVLLINNVNRTIQEGADK